MDRLREVEALRAAIYNGGYMVRHYARGGRVSQASPIAEKRRDAISALGRIVRDAFVAARDEDFEILLTALVDCLASRDDWPKF